MTRTPKMHTLSHDQRWRLAGIGAAVLAGIAVRGGMRAGWKMAAHEDPPLDPPRQNRGWKRAALFSAATGAAVGLARLGARSMVTQAEERPRLRRWRR